jgi:putative phosphonate metabolism protein
MSRARLAVYFAPPCGSPLWEFGCRTIGYDAASGADVVQDPPAGFDAAGWSAATAEPRRYGFHATMKAPFALHTERRLEKLVAALHAFASKQRAVLIPHPVVRAMGRFVALVPAEQPPSLTDLAFAAVEHFEPFRAPLSAEDRARRLASSELTPRQTELLDVYGYPYVAEQFRFHMTLTGALPDDLRLSVVDVLAARHAAAAPGPLLVDRIVLFGQETRDSRFRIVASASLSVG